jgi:hypothetical protein
VEGGNRDFPLSTVNFPLNNYLQLSIIKDHYLAVLAVLTNGIGEKLRVWSFIVTGLSDAGA